MYHEPDLWVSIQEINKKKRQKEIINKHSKLLISPGLIFVQMTIFGVLIFGGKFMIGGDFASQSGDYFWYDLIFWSSYFRGGVYDWRRFCIPKWGLFLVWPNFLEFLFSGGSLWLEEILHPKVGTIFGMT